ncbi:TIR domain-containing protein [Streptococcus sp. E24BD]|uniref:TIR domain-containing protein n=1 Tax=Streptococcus sp. E24BD TaxID=3278715 RepID=UPI00359E632D
MGKVFFSWQSDLPNSTNRSFIESIVEKAIKQVNDEIEFSLETTVDRDTKNILGSPDIANTILEKISKSDIFIADISIINNESKGRKTANPNVLFELGYAVNELGWDRVICLFNSDFGDVSDLPFDLRNRRVIRYDTTNRAKTKQELVKVIVKIIKSNSSLLEIRREVSDYYSINIYSCFITILSRILKVLFGNATECTIGNISKLFLLDVSDIEKQMSQSQLGFNLFRSYEKTVDILVDELDRIVSINHFNAKLYVPIIQLIKELKSYNLYLNRERQLNNYMQEDSEESIYKLVGGENNRYILGKLLNDEQIQVIDFGDVKRKDHIDNSLYYYDLDGHWVQFYSLHFKNCIDKISKFVEINGGEFLIDNTVILLGNRKNTKQDN